MEITLRDVYDVQQQTAERLGHLGSQVDSLATSVTVQLAAGQKKMDDHELRIRSLEKLAWKLIGAFLTIQALSVLLEWWLWSHR